MKFFSTCTVAILLLSNTPALAHPQPVTDIQSFSTRREVVERDNAISEDVNDLWKRKGGGGGGGKGGSGSSGSSGGKGGSGGSGGSSGYVPSSPEIGVVSGSVSVRELGVGSSTSYWSSRTSTSKGSVGGSASSLSGLVKRLFVGVGGSFRSGRGSKSSSSTKSNEHSSSSVPKGSPGSNTGGTTKQGSGVTPNYGGGRYYGGGATTPYTAGSRSPLGIAAVPLAFGAGALAFYPGLWIYGAYAYPYGHPYTFHNRTAHNTTNTTTTTRDLHFDIEIRQETGVEETKPVTCLCAMYAECGCDDNGNTTFLDSLIGDGTYSNLNLSLVNVADINGTSTIVLNGTLPNGTTAAGGTDDAFDSAAMRTILQASGFWPMIALVGLTVFMV